MADWPPKIGSKWIDDRFNPLCREVLWRDDKRVQVRSQWKVKDGSKTHHTLTIIKSMWVQWPGREVDTFK